MRIFLSAGISVALAANLSAALVFSGVQNIPIPDTFDGVYLDFDDYSDPGSFTSSPTVPVSWDINPFFGGAAIATSDTLQPVTLAATVNSNIENLSPGTTVDEFSTYPGTSFSGSTGHMVSEWSNGETGYIGFQIQSTSFTTTAPPGGYTIYGFMEVTLQDDGTTGEIIQWAWDPTGAVVTVIPEPSPAFLLGAMAAGLLVLRRRW